MTSSSLCLLSRPPCSSSPACHGVERGRAVRCGGFSVACRKHRNCVLRRGKKEQEGFDFGGRTISCSAAASTTTHHANDGHRERLAGGLPQRERLIDEQEQEICESNTSINNQSDEEHRHSCNRRSISTNPLTTTHVAAISANAIFTIESTSLRDRIQNFNSLNWRGKASVAAILVCGSITVVFCVTKTVQLVRRASQKLVGKKEESSDEGDSNPYNIVAKGFSTVQSNLGPWSFQDLALGLTAISKVTEKSPPNVPGKPSEEMAKNASFLARAQHWRAMAEVVYTSDPGSFSLQSQLPESAIVAAEWNPCQESLRPAYAVCIDASYGAIVLSVRGTSQIIDMLVNSGASADPFLDGLAHGGFAQATDKMITEVVPHIKAAFEEHSKSQKDLKLVIVGHSMGAAVGIMAGLRLKQEFPNVECWGFSTPACVTLETARGCRDFVTTFVASHDVVPRFSITAVELLRKRICDFDWEGAEKIAGGDEDWGNIKAAADNLKSVEKKQDQMSGSIQQVQEDVGNKVQDVHEKMGSPLRNDDNNGGKQEETKEEEEKEEKEHPPLYPPGRIFVLAADPPGCGKLPTDRNDVPKQRSSGAFPTFEEAKKVKWVLHEADQEELKELVISPWCISDHMIANLGEGLNYLQRNCEPAFGGPPPL